MRLAMESLVLAPRSSGSMRAALPSRPSLNRSLRVNLVSAIFMGLKLLCERRRDGGRRVRGCGAPEGAPGLGPLPGGRGPLEELGRGGVRFGLHEGGLWLGGGVRGPDLDRREEDREAREELLGGPVLELADRRRLLISPGLAVLRTVRRPFVRRGGRRPIARRAEDEVRARRVGGALGRD